MCRNVVLQKTSLSIRARMFLKQSGKGQSEFDVFACVYGIGSSMRIYRSDESESIVGGLVGRQNESLSALDY